MSLSNHFAKMYTILFQQFFEKHGWLTTIYLKLHYLAVWSDNGYDIGGIHLNKGQAICSIRNLAADLDVNKNKITKWLNELEQFGLITAQRTNKFTIVTLIYYEIKDDEVVSILTHRVPKSSVPNSYPPCPEFLPTVSQNMTHNVPEYDPPCPEFLPKNKTNKIIDQIDQIDHNIVCAPTHIDKADLVEDILKPEPVLKELEPPAEAAKPKRSRKAKEDNPKPVKALISTWEKTHEFDKAFTNFHMLPDFQKTFDTEEFTGYLKSLMQELCLKHEEINKLSFEWQEYHNDSKPSKKPVRMKSSFRTWVNNYVNRREKNATNKWVKPVPVDLSRNYEGKYKPDPSKPWTKG